MTTVDLAGNILKYSHLNFNMDKIMEYKFAADLDDKRPNISKNFSEKKIQLIHGKFFILRS
jgi:hypothetical protein